MGEGVGRLHKAVVLHLRAHDDAAGVEIVIQRFGLPQKLRAEDDIPALIFSRTEAVKPTGMVDLMTMMASGFTFITSWMTASTAEVSKKFFRLS